MPYTAVGSTKAVCAETLIHRFKNKTLASESCVRSSRLHPLDIFIISWTQIGKLRTESPIPKPSLYYIKASWPRFDVKNI